MYKNKKLFALKLGAALCLALLVLSNSVLGASTTLFPLEDVIISKINDFRSNPQKYIVLCGKDPQKIYQSFPISYKDVLLHGVPPLKISSPLTLAIQKQLFWILNHKGVITHIGENSSSPEDRAAQEGYNPLLVGESITLLAFESYIPPETALEFILEFLFKNALEWTSAESAPLLFPFYKDLGIAFLGGTIKYKGVPYNIYILGLLFGVTSDALSTSDILLGKIYYHGKNCKAFPLNFVQIEGINFVGVPIVKTESWPDGTFYILKPRFYDLSSLILHFKDHSKFIHLFPPFLPQKLYIFYRCR